MRWAALIAAALACGCAHECIPGDPFVMWACPTDEMVDVQARLLDDYEAAFGALPWWAVECAADYELRLAASEAEATAICGSDVVVNGCAAWRWGHLNKIVAVAYQDEARRRRVMRHEAAHLLLHCADWDNAGGHEAEPFVALVTDWTGPA